MGILSTVLLILFVIVALALIFFVAIQSEENTGLSGVFGGDSSSAFGGRSSKALNKMTTFLGIAFVILAIVIAILKQSPESTLGTQNVASDTQVVQTETAQN
ncbi:MAG: preprotein translocase subunit SecG [Spirochaetales bacterium]|nr:preprotein translocase subunit SecG [Spirochaetales bacterium]